MAICWANRMWIGNGGCVMMMLCHCQMDDTSGYMHIAKNNFSPDRRWYFVMSDTQSDKPVAFAKYFHFCGHKIHNLYASFAFQIL